MRTRISQWKRGKGGKRRKRETRATQGECLNHTGIAVSMAAGRAKRLANRNAPEIRLEPYVRTGQSTRNNRKQRAIFTFLTSHSRLWIAAFNQSSDVDNRRQKPETRKKLCRFFFSRLMAGTYYWDAFITRLCTLFNRGTGFFYCNAPATRTAGN